MEHPGRSTTPPALSRAAELRQLASERLDLLVIGGGIVGAGVARDAAMRGLRVAVIDQFDFSYGTSSRSSRLLHGGIRYLAQGKLRLVRQASVEKQVLHRIAPHLAQPLAFIFPTYRGSGWPFWQLRIGVQLYDWLAGRNLGKSSALSPREIAQRAPGLLEDGRTGAVRYFDGFTQDARLVLDTLRSAHQRSALVLNYARFESVRPDGPDFISIVRDELGGGDLAVRSRAIVNAAGPWAQGLGLSKLQLRLTKGIHVVLDRLRLPLQDAVVITEGARILFVIPWGERVIVGTTDTDYNGPIAEPRSDPEDVAYVLEQANRFFPEARLTPQHIVSTWAGLRPLIADSRGRPSDISREHQILSAQPGWWDVGGGKLTTYRLMAEQTVDAVVKFLGISAGPCSTASTPLLDPSETVSFSQVIPPEFSREAVERFCRNEWAVTLEDVMLRRSSWQQYHRDSLKMALAASDWMAEIFGWSAEQKLAQVRGYLERHAPNG